MVISFNKYNNKMSVDRCYSSYNRGMSGPNRKFFNYILDDETLPYTIVGQYINRISKLRTLCTCYALETVFKSSWIVLPIAHQSQPKCACMNYPHTL